MSSKNLLSLFLCFFKKSDALYLFPTNWLLLVVIDEFTTIEFAILLRNLSFLVPPSTLEGHIYGIFVILRKSIYFRSPLAVCLFYCSFDLLIGIIDTLEKPLVIAWKKPEGLKACNIIKNRLQHRSFPVKFAKLLRTFMLKNICEQLLLNTEAAF